MKKTKLKKFMSNLRRGNYWDTDMVGAVKKYQNFQG